MLVCKFVCMLVGMLVCKFVYAGCEGAGSFAGARCSLAIMYKSV